MSLTATERLMESIGPRGVVDCPSCGDPVFAGRECARCASLAKIYEGLLDLERQQDRKKFLGRLPGRVNMGVVPHAPQAKPMDTGTFLLVGGVGLVVSGLAGFGLWWAMNWAIEWLAEHS
jgi:hypothetical protein